MRPLYSFFWVFSILLLKIHSHGGQGFLTKLKEINWRAITRSIKQDDRPEKIRPQVLISTTSWKGRMGSQFGLFTTCRKRLQKAQLFWEEYNNEYPGKEINTSLVTSINCILLSNKTSWHHKVQDLFETGRRYINRAVDDQIVIFQCLRNIVDFYEVPWNIVEAVQNEIFIAVCYEKTPGWYSSQAWRRELDLTIKHYDSKLIDKDQINKPRKDFRHLLALQKGVSWEDYEEYFHEKRLHPSLIKEINNLLLSSQDSWNWQLEHLFHRADGNEFEQIVLFRSLRELVDFHKITFETLQTLQKWIYWMDSSNSTKGRCISDSECWDYELNLTKKIYNEILEQKVLLLEPGLEISDFLTKQKALGHDGLRLRGDWCPAYQKIIIMFWVTHRKLYSGIIGDHSLQHILETEIVQTHLIETVQKIPHNIGKLQGVYMNWAYSTIKSQSEFILNYIKSIDNQFNSHYFMMKQFKLMPYGLKLARPRIFSNDIKIFQFWSSYVDVFLKMEKLGETPSLETAIGLLVKQEFEETSKIMEKFLIYVDGMEFSPENPVLAQFLYYLAENTSHNEQKELSIGALTEFKKNSPMTHSM